ncbi:hypothetical protein AB0G15_05515 [Streptosporangium sp. NPDC023825]|uniref:hypothetical protein n=1 Tax=Streptosporangium sp. NPDC023825 TaxID=3154909 RepID=UPI00342B4686
MCGKETVVVDRHSKILEIPADKWVIEFGDLQILSDGKVIATFKAGHWSAVWFSTAIKVRR